MTDHTNNTDPAVTASVLGPVRLDVDGVPSDLGGPKPRLLLALLIASRDRSVSVEALIDGLWGDDPPATARKSVQVHVSNLRRALGADGALKTTPGGYVFQTAGVDLDVMTFETEVEAALTLARTDPAGAVDLLTAALSRWHGPAYSDLATEQALQPEISRLTELRLRANELRVDARLRLGQHHDVLGELETLIADHPYREQLRAQHMLALYRCGRQVDALRSYERARHALAEDLGIEPSAMLRELEQQILEQSPAIDASGSADALQTLAFFVTDIVDSTPKWEREPDAMAAGLERHDEILERAVASAGGRIFKHTGDGILAVFPTLDNAAAAAVGAMEEIDGADWPTTDPIRIRAAIDSGPVQERNGDYFGQVLNRVMRIQSSAHGGQLLVHDPVAAATGQPTRSLGEADYKGIGRLPVSQVTTGVLGAEFPPLRTDRAPASMQRPGFSQAIRGYELREQLGAGDFGIVYRAYQASVGREVAVKVIRPEHANDPSFVKRFEAEAQFVAQLEHPHIVSLYDYWRDPEGAYLVMNHLRGGSVAQALERATFNPPAALRVLDQVGGALAYAHRHGVIHGDIKPGNVLLDDDGNAYLSDFGIAHHHVDSVGAPGTTSVAYVAPEEMAGSGRDTRSDIYCLALLAQELLTGRRPALGAQPQPLTELRQDVRAEVGQVIAKAASVDPDHRHDRVEDFLRALRQAFGTDVLTSDFDGGVDADIRNPYKGLRAFAEVDAKDFHGREGLVDELLESIRANGLTAAVGPSGSGKSSAVKAGVLPAVRSGALGGDTDWVVAEMFPGSYPFEELEATLLKIAVERPEGLLADLQHDERGLLRVSKQILPDDGTSLLLVIDQFEELFSLVSDTEVRDRFLDNLVTACRDERSRVRVMVTMRADFFDRPLVHPEFGELMKDGLVPVASPSDENLAVAIARPARDVGLEFEVGLIPAIVQDVAGQPGGLPLLQYVLTELVDDRKGRMLTMQDYEATGGVLGALGRRAEEIYAGLNARGQRAARDLFLRLVSVGDDGDDTRRRIRRSELAAVSSEATALDGVIEQYGSFRLLSFDNDPVTRGPTVEVAHEALISKWPRFEGWVDEHRDDLLHERRIRDAAREWDEHGRDPSYLLRGGRLEQFRSWSEQTRVLPGPLVDDYLEASQVAHDDDEREAAAQADRDQRLRRRSRLLVGTGAGLVLLLVLAALAIVSRNQANDERARAEELASEADTQRELAEASAAEADEQRSRAEGLADELAATDRARALAAASVGQFEGDPQLAVTLALESARATAPYGLVEVETLDALHFSLRAARISFPADDETPVGVRPTADGFQGIFLLPIDQLLALAVEHGRPLNDVDCAAYFAGSTCPATSTAIPGGLEVRGGIDEYLAFTDPERPLAGTDVRVSFSFSDAEAAVMEEDARRGLDQLGIDISVRGIQGLLGREDEFRTFDLWTTPQPGAIRAAARDRQIIDIGQFLDGRTLEDRFGASLAAIGRLDGAAGDPVYAVPYNLDNKSVLWFSKPIFEAGGYEPPTTMQEAVALSDRMVADGVVPWCWSNDTTTGGGGWAVTDWIENIVLRQSGPEVYTGWAAGDVLFTGEPIRRAFETFGDLAFPEGYRDGGAQTIPRANFWTSWADLAGDEPSCAMQVGPHWIVDTIGASPEQRANLGAAAFPAIDARYQDLIVGGGNHMSLTFDSPEARAALSYLTSHAFYRDRLVALPSFIPPDPAFDASELVSESQAEILRITYDALDADGFYFDASDLMPPAVGGTAFFVEPTTWLVEGPDALDGVLQALDDTWPRADADGVFEFPEVGDDVVPIEPGTYRIDLNGASVVTDLPGGLGAWLSIPGWTSLVDSPEVDTYLHFMRPDGLKTLAEAGDPSPDAASIDPRDIDRWLAELPMTAVEDTSFDIEGASVRRLLVEADDSDFNAAACAPQELPCFYVYGQAPDLAFREVFPFTAGFTRVLWVVDPGFGDPIWISFGQRDGEDLVDELDSALMRSLRVEIDADA